MANYEEIKKQQLAEAEQQQAQYEASRNKNAQDYYGQIEKAIDTALEPTKQGIQQQIDATPRQYRSLFDANAVQQRVNERLLQERMANMGLTDSGLNRSQMTALSAQRGNADNAVRMQQQDAIDKLNQQLAEIMAQASANKQQQSANIFAQAANDVLGNRSNLWQSAASNAASVYNAELEREAAAAQLAAQQAYQAAQLAEQQRQFNEELKYKKAQAESSEKQAENDAKMGLVSLLMSGDNPMSFVDAYRTIFGESPTGYASSGGPLITTSSGTATSSGTTKGVATTPSANAVSTSGVRYSPTGNASQQNAGLAITDPDGTAQTYGKLMKQQVDSGSLSREAAINSIIAYFKKQDPEYTDNALTPVFGTRDTNNRITVALAEAGLRPYANQYYDDANGVWMIPGERF